MSKVYGGSFAPGGWVKLQGCETDHKPPSSAKIKETWILYLQSPIRLHGIAPEAGSMSVGVNDFYHFTFATKRRDSAPTYKSREGRWFISKEFGKYMVMFTVVFRIRETVIYMKNGVLWDVTPCDSCTNRRFGGN
jgi:hypothetical protein